MSLTAKQSDILLGKVFIRRSEIFVLVCGNSRYPSQLSCVVSQQRQAALLLLLCLSRRLRYYQPRCMQMCIKISVKWRHDITNVVFGWGKGHIIEAYSVIRRAVCLYYMSYE